MKRIKKIVLVEMEAYEVAHLFITGHSDDQIDFLENAAKSSERFNWCMQSSYIARDMENKAEVIDFLETLLGHLKHPEETK